MDVKEFIRKVDKKKQEILQQHKLTNAELHMFMAGMNAAIDAIGSGDGNCSGWIPVEERSPECEWGAETSELLYQYKETGTIEVGYYGRGGKFRDSYFRHYRNVSDGIDSSDVIAWMPLPEPYKPQNLAYADNDTAQPGLQSAT